MKKNIIKIISIKSLIILSFLFFITIYFSCNKNIIKESYIDNQNLNVEYTEDFIIESSKLFLYSILNNLNLSYYEKYFSKDFKNKIDKTSFENVIKKWKSTFNSIIYLKILNYQFLNQKYYVKIETYHYNYILNFLIIWDNKLKIDFFSLEKFENINNISTFEELKQIEFEKKIINNSLNNHSFIEYTPKNTQANDKLPLIIIFSDFLKYSNLNEYNTFYNNLRNYFLSKKFIILEFSLNNNLSITNKIFTYDFLINFLTNLKTYIESNSILKKESIFFLSYSNSCYYIPLILKLNDILNLKLYIKGVIFLNPILIDIFETYKKTINYLIYYDGYITKNESKLLEKINSLSNEEIIKNEFFYDNNMWNLLKDINMIEEINNLKFSSLILQAGSLYFVSDNKVVLEKFNNISSSFIFSKNYFSNLNSIFSQSDLNISIINLVLSINIDNNVIEILNSYLNKLLANK